MTSSSALPQPKPAEPFKNGKAFLRNSWTDFLSRPYTPKVKFTSQGAKIWHNAWGEASTPLSPNGLAGRLQRHSGLITIQGIDDRTFALITETFKTQELYHFLYQHAARVENPQATSSHGHTRREVVTSGPLVEKQKPSFWRQLSGLHFDGFCSTAVIGDTNSIEMQDATTSVQGGLTFANNDDHLLVPEDDTRTETFVSDGSRWHRTSTRISCCQLTSDLYLVLIDPPFSIPLVNTKEMFKDSFPVLPSKLTDQAYPVGGLAFDAYEILRRLSANFSLRDVLVYICRQPVRRVHEDASFHCLIVVSEWQSIVEDIERDMRHLQSQAAESKTRTALLRLSKFRRILAGTRESIADDSLRLRLLTRKAVLEYISMQERRSEAFLDGGDPLEMTTLGDREKTSIVYDDDTTEALDIPDLLNRLTNLEARLDTIARTLNEEVQLFIALVTIQDSEIMIADSKIMKEQAARTTLLTTLAVIYLPLQLITGIFGMNVREITGSGSVSWWACLIALSIGALITLLVFLGVRWWNRGRDSQRTKREEQEKKEV